MVKKSPFGICTYTKTRIIERMQNAIKELQPIPRSREMLIAEAL
jgi:hypothetical protein